MGYVFNKKRTIKGVIISIARRINELLDQCAEMYGWEIREMNIQLAHVHMLIQLKPDVSVSRAVQLFKGESSRIIGLEFPELEEFLWGDSFWADGFFS